LTCSITVSKRRVITRRDTALPFDLPTIRTALAIAQTQIAPASYSASLDAQVLLCAVLKVERAYLVAHPEQTLTPDQHQRYTELVNRAAAGDPLAYILGRRNFYDREFLVTPAVLIPRPETELLLEQAIAFIQQKPDAVVVDVGTGSGALAVTLAAHCPQAQVYATDISPDALVVARHNAESQQVKIAFLQGDLLQPLIEHHIQVDVVVANLPYIASDELVRLDVSRYEPHLALDGGLDGLDLIRRLLQQAPDACKPDARLLLEIGAGQGTAITQLVQNALRPQRVDILPDYAGLDRIVRVHLK
jgi:release factor glutamine methyltransferase